MVQIQDVTLVDDDAARLGERLRLAGNAAYNAGDFEAAARSYRDSLEAAPLPSPSAPKALGNLAKALLMLGHPGEALANAERYVQACPPGTPDAAKARFRKGEALEAKGDLRAAREAYRDAAKDAPGDEKVRGALARVSEAIEQRRRESAEPDVNVSAKAETRFETAETSRRRSPPRATKTLTSRLDDGKKNEAAYVRAKRALREARYEDAFEAFEAYVLPPSRPDRALSLFLNRARALTELGRHEEALRDARAAVRVDEASPRARYRLGVAALAAAEAAAEQLTRMVSVLSHDENVTKKTADLRSRAEALAREARDEGFGYGARLENVFEKYDDASAFAAGREKCETFLTSRDVFLPFPEKGNDVDRAIVDPERKPTKSTPEKEKPEGVSVRDPPAEKRKTKKTGAATVPVSSLAAYARRETARRERLGSEKKKDPSDSRTFEHEHDDDDFSLKTFRESVRVFGCAVVRLPASLNDDVQKNADASKKKKRSPRDVFGDAVAAASAFFRMRPEEKKRSLPNTRAAPHGYLRPLEETRVDSLLLKGSRARRDETVLERFSACDAFDAAYVWPSAKFKARVDDARSVLEETAKVAGDAFLIERFAEIESLNEREHKIKHERLEAYEAKLDAMMFAPENQRTTLAKHPDAEGKKKRVGGDDDDDDATAKLRAALDPIVRESEAEPERNFLSFFPRVCVAKTTEADDEKKKTRTPAVRVRRGDLETTFSAAPTATDADLDVLVVAGERFRDIMGEAWPLPTVSFDGEEREGPCVRLVYRV